MSDLGGRAGVYAESERDVVCAECDAPVDTDCRENGIRVYPHVIRQAHTERFHQLVDGAFDRRPEWPRSRRLLKLARNTPP